MARIESGKSINAEFKRIFLTRKMSNKDIIGHFGWPKLILLAFLPILWNDIYGLGWPNLFNIDKYR